MVRRKKKWKKIVQTGILLVLVTVLSCPLTAIAQTENEVNEKSEVAEEKDSNTKTQLQEDTLTETDVEEAPEAAEEKDSNTENQQPNTPQIKNTVNGMLRTAKANNNEKDSKIDALIQALGGESYASSSCTEGQCNVILKKSATVNSGTLTIPRGVGLIVDGSDKTLTVGASVNFVIETGGYVSLYGGSFMKVDCAISGSDKEGILLGEDSSISALSSLGGFGPRFIIPILPYGKPGKVVSCTDWKEARTVYAPIDAEVNPEAFIIRADGSGKAYGSLGWSVKDDLDAPAPAFSVSKAGDTIYLLKDFITDPDGDGKTEGINCPLKKDVTLVIKDGQTFDIGILSLRSMASGSTEIPAEGTIIAFSGSQCKMPMNDSSERTPFIGTTELSLLKLDKGIFKLELPQAVVTSKAANKAASGRPAQAILGENSEGTFCQPLYLTLLNDPMDFTVGENSTLTVESLLVVDGNQKLKKNPSNLTLNKGATLQTQGGGILYLDAFTKTYLKEGTSFSAESIDGDITLKDGRAGFQSYFKGLLSVEPDAGLELQNEKLFGGQDAYLSLKSGTAELTLGKADSEAEPTGKAPNQLKLTDGSEAVLNSDWSFELTSKKAPFYNYLKDLTTGTGSTLTLNAALTMPAGSTLNHNGTIVVGPEGKLILDENASLNNNGQIILLAGGEVIGANSFKLMPFQDKDFRSEEEGYKSPESLDVTVVNNEKSETPPLTVSLSGNNADAFSLMPSGSIGSLVAGSKEHFTVAPVEGLKEGTYTANVTVSSDYVSATFQVSFTVTKASPGGNPDPETPPTDDPSSGKDTPADSGNTKLPNSGGNNRTPMTGDVNPSMGLLALLMILSLAVGGTTVLGYRRKVNAK